MYRSLIIVMCLVACNGDTSFTSTGQNEEEIQGSGGLSYSPEQLVFSDLTVGNTVSQDITFNSIGDVNLNLYEVRTINTGGGVFYVPDTQDLVIGPGSSLNVTVTATLSEEAPAEGLLRVKSSDADYIEFTIDLLAYPLGYEPPDSGDSGA